MVWLRVPLIDEKKQKDLTKIVVWKRQRKINTWTQSAVKKVLSDWNKWITTKTKISEAKVKREEQYLWYLEDIEQDNKDFNDLLDFHLDNILRSNKLLFIKELGKILIHIYEIIIKQLKDNKPLKHDLQIAMMFIEDRNIKPFLDKTIDRFKINTQIQDPKEHLKKTFKEIFREIKDPQKKKQYKKWLKRNDIPCFTYIVFRLLNKIVSQSQLSIDKSVVDFITLIESRLYEVNWNDFENIHQTLLWLQSNIKTKDLLELLKYSSNSCWLSIISNKDLERQVETNLWLDIKLKTLSENVNSKKQKAKKEFDELVKKWFILEFEWQKFVVDLWNSWDSKNFYIQFWNEIAYNQWYGLIKLHESGDLYLFSPIELEFESLNKKWTVIKNRIFLQKNCNEEELLNLLEQFQWLRKIKNAIIKKIWKQNAINWTREQDKKSKLFNKEKTTVDEKVNKLKSIQKLSKLDLKKWKEYKWVVKFIQRNMIIVSLWNFDWAIYKSDFKNREDFVRLKNSLSSWDDILVGFDRFTDIEQVVLKPFQKK